MPLIIPPAPFVGTQESAGWATQVVAALTALNTYAQMEATANTAPATGATVPIPWTTATHTSAMGTSLTQGIQVSAAGDYEVSAVTGFAANATGRRVANFSLNGVSNPRGRVETPASAVAGMPTQMITVPAVMFTLAAGTWVNLQAYQTSGVALAVGGFAANGSATLTVRRVG